MSEYRLSDPRQGIIGPVRLETVRDLVSAGVIQDDVLVSKDGGAWLPVKNLGEIFGHPRPAATALKASYAGDLGKNTFFKVFYRFHLAQANGLLTVKSPPKQKDIYLENGQTVFVASNVESERLGEFIKRAGSVDPHDIDVAIAAMASDNNHLGATLVRLGLMEEADFRRILIEQQVERLVELCRWRSGQYVFFDGARYLGEKLDLGLGANELILRAARSMDATTLAERLRLHIDEVVTRRPHAELDGGAFALTAIEERALALIDGQRTVAELVKQFSDVESRRAAFTLIYLLWEIDAAAFDALG